MATGVEDLAVDLFAIPYLHDKNLSDIVLNATDDAIISNAVFPKGSESGAL
jgi:hypothetical protein